MLKITMMLGSFDRLLGESNMAQAIDVARIVDNAGLHAIAVAGVARATTHTNYSGPRRPTNTHSAWHSPAPAWGSNVGTWYSRS